MTESSHESTDQNAISGFSSVDTSDIKNLSFEVARQQLMEIVTRLEAGSASLEESLALWERGEVLAQHCQDWLDGARQRIATVTAQKTSQPEE